MADYLRLADFKTKEVTGTTNSVADTKQQFRHSPPSAPGTPVGWMVLEGKGIYVPRHGAGAEEIDVRSTSTSQQFRLLLFFL